MDVRKIYEGWRNNLLPPSRLKETINRVSAHRTEICEKCEHHSSNRNPQPLRFDKHCTVCGCTISAKTKCLSCDCPKGKWKALLSEEEEEYYENRKHRSEPSHRET